MLQRYDGFPLIPKNCEESSVSCCDGVGDMRQWGRIGVKSCRNSLYFAPCLSHYCLLTHPDVK